MVKLIKLFWQITKRYFDTDRCDDDDWTMLDAITDVVEEMYPNHTIVHVDFVGGG